MNYPRKGDNVIDRMGKTERKGVVIGRNYVKDSSFVKVKFEGQAEIEEMEEDSFFTKENCGYGEWDSKLQAWVMTQPEDALPEDDPFCFAFNKSIENLNINLLKDRLGSDWNLNVIQLEKMAIENELEATRIGSRDPYYNFYKSKGEDYRRAIEFRLKETA